MRVIFSTSWIFQGWITYLMLAFCAQTSLSKSLQCGKNQYLKDSKCCEKCGPGTRVYADCTESKDTSCRSCDRGEYQPGWTQETLCLQQKICDEGKGFMPRRENLLAEEPCHCRPNLQCSTINCEYCEKIPVCRPGQGLEADPDSTNGRRVCVPCKKGFFSPDLTAQPCKQWTNCKALSRSERQPGGPQTDAICGPPISDPTFWVIVSVLSVITILSLLILLLFCYKDKLKLLSVNLRSCVQNLKRTRIQQETLAPLYHSGGAGGGAGGPIGGPGGPDCTPCETTKLVCEAARSPPAAPCAYPPLTPLPEIKVSLPPHTPLITTATAEEEEEEGLKVKIDMEACTEDGSEGSGEPEEVTEEEEEEEEEEEAACASPLWAGSCVCVTPVRQPLEVGENEDCSQAVGGPVVPGHCMCGGPEGERDGCVGDGNSGASERRDERASKASSSESEAGDDPSLRSLSPPSPSRELCVPLSQAGPEVKVHLPAKGEEPKGLTSLDSASTAETTPTMTSTVSWFNPSLASSSVGDLYQEACGEEDRQEDLGLSWRHGPGNKLSSGESELECPPESLQSQLVEPALTSGQVRGNNNTTFISSGQVMNFSGDVIVVYVSQTSLGSGGEGAGLEDAFGSPVQEQANETAPLFQSSLATTTTTGDSITHNSSSQAGTLPVQEVMDEWPRGK